MMMNMRQKGFTLTEVLIVVAILLLILILVLINLKPQIDKARDSRRKTDLSLIQKSFEEYYNDTKCYPDSAVLNNCGSTTSVLSPYLKSIPCDSVTKNPYLYVANSPSLCTGYRLCAKLDYDSDPDIERLGCDSPDGCGWMGGYNYCLTAGVSAAANGQTTGFTINWSGSSGASGTSGASGSSGTSGASGAGGITGTPTPTVQPGYFYCVKANPGEYSACNNYADPVGAGCPLPGYSPGSGCIVNGTYMCDIQANRCTIY